MELLQAKQPRQTLEAAVYLNKITKAIVQITILRAGTSKAQHRPGVTETVPMPEDEHVKFAAHLCTEPLVSDELPNITTYRLNNY